MKKLFSALLSIACLLSCAAAIMPASDRTVQPDSSSTVLTAFAADASELIPGKNAASYKFKYADSTCYKISVTPVSIYERLEDNSMRNWTQWPLDPDTSKPVTDAPLYSYYKIDITHTEGNNQVVKDLSEYRIGLSKGVTTALEDTPCQTVEVPEFVKSYMEKNGGGVEIADNGKATVIGPNAYTNAYLKNIDLTGITYIGKNAFSSCKYITEITIPASVRSIGDGAFLSSGLKTLDIKCDLPVIPVSLCESTQLTKITLAHPEQVRRIGKSAFKNTPLTSTLFAGWVGKDVSKYESLTVDDSAYENCVSIKSVKMPDNLIFLEKSVFKGCTSLSELVIGKNTLSLDAECCANCTALDSITFNDVLYSLGGGVFSGCTSLKKVENMPDTLEDWVAVTQTTGYGFGNNMFANCKSLTSVALPKSITKIPEGVFKGCTALNYVYNSENITSIAKEAFQGCQHLLEAKYPKVTAIENYAFDGCSDLKEIVFENCTSIGDYAFRKCSSATKFSVGSCKTVGMNALESCSSLKSIKLLSDSYGAYVFKDCTAAATIEIKCDKMAQTPKGMCSGCSALTTLKGDLSKVPIISDSTFADCTSLQNVDFSSVRIIEQNAFSNCTSLKSICKGAITAEDYGTKCFYNCSALSAEVSGSISTIGMSAFQKSGITKVDVNGMVGGTVVVGQSAFADCPSLASATILSPEGAVFSVKDGVFTNCPKLTTAVYAGPIITTGMFKNCTALNDVQISAPTINASAFENCSSLTMVKSLDDPTKSIIAKEMGGAAFKNCSALKTAPSDKNTTYTGTQQYFGCEALTKAETSMLTAGMFSGCTKLASVSLASDITAIPESAFENCKALTAMNLNDMLSIGSKAFAGSGIKEVKIENAQKIGMNAFSGCDSLTKADVSAELIDTYAFTGDKALKEATICTAKINSFAFKDCSALSKVTLQNSDSRVLDYIGTDAFTNCASLTDLVIPGSPSKIEYHAFGFTNSKVTEDFLCAGASDSTVKTYADTYKVPFCDIKDYNAEERAKRNTPGDVDGNGLVSVADAVKLTKFLLGTDTEPDKLKAGNADLNKDQKINAVDLTLLKMKLLKR